MKKKHIENLDTQWNDIYIEKSAQLDDYIFPFANMTDMCLLCSYFFGLCRFYACHTPQDGTHHWRNYKEKRRGETACMSSLLLARPSGQVGVPLANLACLPRGSTLSNSEERFTMSWLHADQHHTPSDSTYNPVWLIYSGSCTTLAKIDLRCKVIQRFSTYTSNIFREKKRQ